MSRARHISAALAATALVVVMPGTRMDVELAYLGVGIAVGLTMLPDVYRRVPFVRHRGPTQTG